MDKGIQKSTIYLTEVETLAQDILTAKEQKLDLSNAKNKFNEAVRAIEKTEHRTVLLDMGKSLFEFPRDLALDILKEDMKEATEEMDKLHNDIKEKVSKLRDLEHEPKIEGISLKPMTGAEAKAIQRAFGL